jgi:hypothetical protein
MNEEHKSLAVTNGSSKSLPKKRGRPKKEITPERIELREALIAWISSGRSLNEFCKLHGSITRQSVYNWIDSDKQFAIQFARARDSGCDVIAEDCQALADTEPVDQVQAAWRRLQVDTRLRLLAKWHPKKYGDRTAVDHGGGVTLTVTTGVPLIT